jgi:transposase-like zinc-binding protein/putative transposase
MGSTVRCYQPRHAEASVRHRVIREHLEDFLRAAADRADGAGLPEFITREFREFLTCGVLTHGFARVRCRRCAFERRVPFSCKGRGYCPSCGGRRMTERAAHLVDEVLPVVPVRQWVLTLPYRLRYLLAWDHGLSRAVLAVYARTLVEYFRRQANSQGIRDGRTGTLTVIQRVGSGLNLNVHFHTLVFDGVFRRTPEGGLTFHPAFPLAPRARWRSQVVRYARPAAGDPAPELEARHRGAGPTPAGTWAALMRRVVALDVLACPRCGGRLRVLATVQDPVVVRAILAHLGLAPASDTPGPAPPQPDHTAATG